MSNLKPIIEELKNPFRILLNCKGKPDTTTGYNIENEKTNYCNKQSSSKMI